MPNNKQQLDDFLRHLHLDSEVYYVGQLCNAWHMSIPDGHATTFHLVCNGDAWVHMPNLATPIQMRTGDIAFFSNDAQHTFSGVRTVPDQPFDYSKPAPLDKNAPGTGLLCGHLKLPAHIRRLLLASFPEFMLIRPNKGPLSRQMRSLIELMTEEASLNDLGASAVLDRLSDTLFLYVIRHTLHVDPKLSPLLAGLSDEYLHPAIVAFIDSPSEPWTVERMAKLACQSRSSFSERFTALIKMSPMEFVTAWRMQLAVGYLGKDNANMLDIALRCGYESEASFRKAFKRIIGVTPGQAHRREKAVPMSD